MLECKKDSIMDDLKFNVTFDITIEGVIVYTPQEGPTTGKPVEMTFRKPNQIAYINRLTT